MVPDSTAVAQGALWVTAAVTSYPVLSAILSVTIIVGLGTWVITRVKRVAR